MPRRLRGTPQRVYLALAEAEYVRRGRSLEGLSLLSKMPSWGSLLANPAARKFCSITKALRLRSRGSAKQSGSPFPAP